MGGFTGCFQGIVLGTYVWFNRVNYIFFIFRFQVSDISNNTTSVVSIVVCLLVPTLKSSLGCITLLQQGNARSRLHWERPPSPLYLHCYHIRTNHCLYPEQGDSYSSSSSNPKLPHCILVASSHIIGAYSSFLCHSISFHINISSSRIIAPLFLVPFFIYSPYAAMDLIIWE